MLKLYDTASRQVAELQATAGGTIGMYVCGPTVYGPPHIGHGRAALVFDVLHRYLSYTGATVRHVSNITDIDDKIIERAALEGRPWREVVAQCEAEWWSAMGALGVARPDLTPHATEYLEQMIELIGELVAAKAAYATSEGVYLAVDAVPGYGSLSGQSIDQLRAGARVEVGEHKRAPTDFALWKTAKPGEPSWPAPFGAGRPGWHTECVVMSLELLGEGFTLHGGGQDLIFPHHENELAQASALGRRFARHWVHNGFVVSGGEKMSKSLGNTTPLAELVTEHDPRAYRLLVLQSHYRQPLEVGPQALADASSALGRIDAIVRRLGRLDTEASADEHGDELRGRFRRAMDDDLDTPAAVAALFDAVREVNASLDRREAARARSLADAVLECFGALGLETTGAAEVPAEVLELMRARDEARRSRDFARADEIRGALESRGWRVEDGPDGTRVHH